MPQQKALNTLLAADPEQIESFFHDLQHLVQVAPNSARETRGGRVDLQAMLLNWKDDLIEQLTENVRGALAEVTRNYTPAMLQDIRDAKNPVTNTQAGIIRSLDAQLAVLETACR